MVEVIKATGETELLLKRVTPDEVRRLIGGWLELAPHTPEDVQIWCDEEGRLKNKPINQVASLMVGYVLRGDVVKLTGDDLMK